MKQRLLLALLVLFASVGSTWGAGTGTLKLNVAKGGSLTVSFSATTTFTPAGGTEQSTTSFQITSNDTKTVAVERTLTIADLEFTTSNGVRTPTPRTITITGSNVTGVTINGDFMTALDIRNVGLTDFSISNATNLTSLAIGDNKLPIDKIPAKGSYTSYKVGTQTPDLSNYGLSTENQKPANQALDLTIDKLLTNNSPSPVALAASTTSIANESAYTIQGWKYKAANATSYSGTSYPHTDTSAPNRYYFYSGSTTYVDGNEWMHGDYTCDIKIAETSTEFPGVIISGIPVKVKPATYIWKEIDIVPAGSGNNVTVLDGSNPVTIDNNNTIEKGNKFTIIPVVKDGYTFAGVSAFTAKGFTITKNADTDNYTAEVNGKVKEVSLSMTFTAAKQSVSFEQPANGTIEMYDGNTKLSNPASVETGKKLTVKFIPHDGYSIAKDNILINGTKASSVETVDWTSEGNILCMSYPVGSETSTLITATFKAGTSSVLTVKYKDSDIETITVDGGNLTAGSDDNGYKVGTSTVAYNTTPVIQIVTKAGYTLSSVLVDNEKVDYKLLKTEGGKSTYLITTFKMPNKKVTMVLTASSKLTAKIKVSASNVEYVSGTSGAQYAVYRDANNRIVYDGTVKAIPYTTDPAGLTGVVTKYKPSKETSDAYLVPTGYINASKEGTYYIAQLTRPADNTFAAVDKVTAVVSGGTDTEVEYIAFQIEQATPVVTKAPEIKIDESTGAYKFTSNGTVVYARGTSNITIDSKKYVWEVVEKNNSGVWVKAQNATKNSTTQKYDTDLVTVRLQLKDDVTKDYSSANKDNNFKAETIISNVQAKGNGTALPTVQLAVYSGLPAGTSLEFMNGDISLGKSATVPVGTVITFKASAPGYSSAKITQVDNQGNPVGSFNSAFESASYTVTATSPKVIFTITGTAPESLHELELISAEDAGTGTVEDNNVYNGQVQLFNTSVIKVKDKTAGTDTEVTGLDWTNATITYKDAKGQATTTPINAGEYAVTISRPADEPSTSRTKYKAFTVTGKLIIHQAEPTIIKWPNTAVNDEALIGKGQPLSSAILTGGEAAVEGTFEWVSPNQIVNVDGAYEIKFVSKDPNYKDVIHTQKAKVKISNESILSIASDDTYTITVKGSDGKEYKSGQTVPVGITLTFTVNPAATYKLKALYVNGVAISGNTYKTTAGPIAVKAEMEQEFTVSVTTAVKGIQLVLPTSNVVKKGAAYSFSVKGLAADLANLVVSDGTNIYTSTNGAYTISNITANKTITVTMKAGTAPTQVEAVIEANLSTQGKSMGTVTVTKISSLRADAVDSSIQKFYYGDKIRITATPAAGCRFVGWEGRTETSSVIDVTITDTSYKFKAVFAGSPTGAEVIEGVDIYGSNGEIVVKCDGAARITIVSMNGQSKQQEISGDTRIPAGAGIYGIVFEQGKNVMRTKVAVK